MSAIRPCGDLTIEVGLASLSGLANMPDCTFAGHVVIMKNIHIFRLPSTTTSGCWAIPLPPHTSTLGHPTLSTCSLRAVLSPHTTENHCTLDPDDLGPCTLHLRERTAAAAAINRRPPLSCSFCPYITRSGPARVTRLDRQGHTKARSSYSAEKAHSHSRS
jgi:hypothetical protein